jgi:hypothetical protein
VYPTALKLSFSSPRLPTGAEFLIVGYIMIRKLKSSKKGFIMRRAGE